jgi:hypothetical protein
MCRPLRIECMHVPCTARHIPNFILYGSETSNPQPCLLSFPFQGRRDTSLLLDTIELVQASPLLSELVQASPLLSEHLS